MTTLVTGGTGFVGSAVVRRLLDSGRQVRVLVRPRSDRRNLEGLDVELALGDLTDADSISRAVRGCKELVHVAADFRLWVPNPQAMYEANVNGSVALLSAAADAGIGRIVHTSTAAVLGHTTDGSPADEDTPSSLEDMIGHYKRSKYLAEQEVLRLVREQGVPAVIVNPSGPVGPRDIKPTPTGRLILDAATGRMPAYVDTGLNMVHVDDVANGHLLALERGKVGERYILGGEDLSVREILKAVSKIAGRRPPIMKIPHGALVPIAQVLESWARLFGGEPRVTLDAARLAKQSMFVSSQKARTNLGYRSRPAREAFQDAVEWFRANGYS